MVSPKRCDDHGDKGMDICGDRKDETALESSMTMRGKKGGGPFSPVLKSIDPLLLIGGFVLVVSGAVEVVLTGIQRLSPVDRGLIGTIGIAAFIRVAGKGLSLLGVVGLLMPFAVGS